MKILHIINGLGMGGAEKLLLDTVPLYEEKGIEVDILLMDNTRTHFWVALEERIKGKIQALTSGSIYNPFLILKIIPYLKGYDYIHLHLFPTLYWVVLAKWISFADAKLIFTEHSTTNRRRNNIFLKFIDRFIYKKLNTIVTISDEVDYNIKKHLNFSNEKFKKIYNGVPISLFHEAKPYSKSIFFDDGSLILIQVSSFRLEKEQQTVIKSLQFLPESVKLLLVGEGNFLNECKALAEELNLGERIKFLGNRTDVPRLLATADIIILSSKYEGLSLSNVEGMATGKPFIGSDVPGLKEIVKGYGLLFERGNERELADLIGELSDNKEFYQTIGDQCYNRAKDFDIAIMIDKHIQLYDEICQSQN